MYIDSLCTIIVERRSYYSAPDHIIVHRIMMAKLSLATSMWGEIRGVSRNSNLN